MAASATIHKESQFMTISDHCPVSELMTIAEVAEALNIGKTTVLKLLGRGDLPIRVVRVGYHWRFSRRDVMAFCHGELIEEHNNVEAA